MTTYTWDFGSVDAGLKFNVVYDSDTQKFTVTSLTGSLNVNALYWTDGDGTSSESSYVGFTGAKSESSLNMAGTNVLWNADGTQTTAVESWDGGLKISNAGLGTTPPDSYIVAGTDHASFTIDAANFDPTLFGTLGVRATSTSTAEGSIKWVDEAPEVDNGTQDDFPTWAQDISNVVLYFDQTAGDTKPNPDGDGYYTVKINTTEAAGDDLDAWVGDALTWLQANDPNIDENSELLGVAIKGGTEPTQYFAYGDSNLNGTDPDMIPDGAPEIVTPPAQGNVDPSAIDQTYQYDGTSFTDPELVA